MNPLLLVAQAQPERYTISNPTEIVFGIVLMIGILVAAVLLGKAFDYLMNRSKP
jgi:hypothetical protein